MRRTNFIAFDVHCGFCEGGYIDQLGREREAWQTPTSIPELVEVIETVPRPRKLVIEEGPLADWLQRNVSPHVDEMIVCDPRRNALISKEGEKSDALDWRKLAGLYRGGYVKAVHHPASLQRSLFKQHVQLYHERVRHRVSEGQKIIWRVRRLGVFIKQKDLEDDGLRKEMIAKLPADEVACQDVELLLEGYDLALKQTRQLKRRLIELAKKEPMIGAFRDIPGVDWVRAATFLVFLDTPYRFKKKEKLWKYIGIGLERRQSGQGSGRLRSPTRCSRPLKWVILGAAKSAIASKDNVFADQYQRWLNEGCSPWIACRNLARSLATVMWGMWKSGSVFDPNAVGEASAQVGKTLATAH
jgi:transposase